MGIDLVKNPKNRASNCSKPQSAIARLLILVLV